MYSLIQPLLFLLPPEKAHALTLQLLHTGLRVPGAKKVLERFWGFETPDLEKEVAGMHFRNPVGLAAGFDKNGEHLEEMSMLGFGFLELGTVTPKPQKGNPQPRLFRLPADNALINRMGFNNNGVEALAARLEKQKPPGIIIGGNIGKNKTTPNEKAVDDYAFCFERLHGCVDYFVVNVSSPNTPGLRALQERGPLQELLEHLQRLNRAKSVLRPIFLKIAPDLEMPGLNDIVDLVGLSGIAGIIATNTTISRAGLKTSSSRIERIGSGGLSGQPVRNQSTEIIRFLRKELPRETSIIGVGGISEPVDALEKLEAGADLIQLYTGLVFEGPTLIKRIKKSIATQR